MASTSATALITDVAVISNCNRGPISGVFSATSCLSTLTSGSPGMYFGHNQEYFDTACYPSPTTTVSSWDLYYYSPAISCPSGWHNAKGISGTMAGYPSIYITVGPETTALLCCPSGYDAGALDHQCITTYQPGATDTITYISPSSLLGNWTRGTPTTITHTEPSNATSYWTMLGDGIPIWYQASDLVSSTASKTSSPSTSATSTSIPPPTNSPSPAPSPTRLSTGAKVGIGLGTAVGVLLLAAVAGFCLFKRKTYNAAPSDVPEIQSDHKFGAKGQDRHAVQELYSDGTGNYLNSSGRYELLVRHQ